MISFVDDSDIESELKEDFNRILYKQGNDNPGTKGMKRNKRCGVHLKTIYKIVYLIKIHSNLTITVLLLSVIDPR